jgi:zinc transporter, ZIP family
MTPPADTAVVHLGGRRVPAWVLALGPLALVALLIAALFAFDLPGLDRRGGVQEILTAERTVLRPGQIEVHVRNDGPDPVSVAQVMVNDAFVPTATVSPETIGRLDGAVARIPYDWLQDESLDIALLTSTGVTIDVRVEQATETPDRDAGFFGLMALLGLYVGIIPVTVGMLWLPFVRRASAVLIRFFMAVTVGLLAFLAIDALVTGIETGGRGPQAFGGAGLALLGALVAYVALSGVDAAVSRRKSGSKGQRLAMLIAVGIGLHNLGEGLAIGSAYALGELALGAFLVVGFALHNTTEGLAIVAPIAEDNPRAGRLVALGAVAGAPAILGAWIGGVAFTPQLAAFLLGAGAGAIVQVAIQIAPSLREAAGGRIVTPLTACGLGTGLAVMYATGLLTAGV